MVERLANTPANAQRIANVESCFASGEPLAIPGRVLVGEGVLTKMCRKKPKPRQFFLFNDILVYGNIILSKKKYNKQRIIPLEHIKIESLEDDGPLKNGWLIKTPTKSFAVYAATATEKAEWIAHIKKCLNDLLNKTGKQPSEEHAAVWVPDTDASVCMHCKAVQFTLINRKHHCRKCGKVVCGGCSTKKYLIPSMASKPLRVCDGCFDTLTSCKPAASSISKTETAPMRPPPPPPPVKGQIAGEQEDLGDKDSDEDSDDELPQLNVEGVEKEIKKLSIDDDKPTFYNDVETPAVVVPKVEDEQPLISIDDEPIQVVPLEDQKPAPLPAEPLVELPPEAGEPHLIPAEPLVSSEDLPPKAAEPDLIPTEPLVSAEEVPPKAVEPLLSTEDAVPLKSEESLPRDAPSEMPAKEKEPSSPAPPTIPELKSSEEKS